MVKRASRIAFVSLTILFFVANIAFAETRLPIDYQKVFLKSENSAGTSDSKPENNFDCGDKIYAIVELGGLRKTDHKLVVSWISPQKRLQEKTVYPFRAVSNPEILRVWLKLHADPYSAAERALFSDPSIGLSNFVGMWTAIFELDGLALEKKSFLVSC